MTEKKSEKWYIDTLDARGGIAFASYRNKEQQGDDTCNESKSTVFISAPSFSAEPIMNRATALAAGRGSFQQGLFSEGEEVSFATLPDLTAFVSRLYGAGGGGDSPGDGEGPPPRPEGSEPPPEGDNEPLRIERQEGIEGNDATLLLQEDAGRFSKMCREKIGEAGNQFNWFEEKTTQSTRVFDPSPLESAAVRLEREIWSRLPTNGKANELLIWLESANSLLNIVKMTGLDWGRLQDTSVSYLQKYGSRSRLPKDFFGSKIKHKIVSLFHCVDSPYSRYFGIRMFDNGNGGDPIEFLSKIPLTNASRKALKIAHCPEEDLNLFSLLTVGAAAPQVLIKDKSQQTMQEFLFAACLIVAATKFPPLRDRFWFAQRHTLHHHLQTRSLSKLQQKTLVWLKGSFPNRALPQPLEKMISEAPGLAYEYME